MSTMLILAGLLVAAAVILALFWRLVRRDGGEPEPEGATVYYAAELRDLNAEPPAVDDGEQGPQRLAADWRDLVTPVPVPELDVEPPAATLAVSMLPAEPAAEPEYRSRHHDDTVELVAEAYRPLYSPAFAAVVGYDRHDTAYMEPIR